MPAPVEIHFKRYGMSFKVERTPENERYLRLMDLGNAHWQGLHQDFKGRRYRRGHNRCDYCGAKFVY